MANKYTVWYKKEIKAKDYKDALDKAKKVKPEFYSMKAEEESKDQLPSAIGFQYHPEYIDYD
jgi:hypothetical protein